MNRTSVLSVFGLTSSAERHVGEIELAVDADHVAVEVLLDERAVGADAELAAEHDVERVRRCAPRLVAELQPGHLLLA